MLFEPIKYKVIFHVMNVDPDEPDTIEVTLSAWNEHLAVAGATYDLVFNQELTGNLTDVVVERLCQ